MIFTHNHAQGFFYAVEEGKPKGVAHFFEHGKHKPLCKHRFKKSHWRRDIYSDVEKCENCLKMFMDTIKERF